MNRNPIGAVLFVFGTFGAALASADTLTTFNIAFTGTGALPTSGSFTYDSTTPTFTNFLVTWNGITFDLTSAANNPTLGGTPGCLGGATGAAASFAFLSGACFPPPPTASYGWFASTDPKSPTTEISAFTIGEEAPVPSFDILIGTGSTALGIDLTSGQGGFSISQVPEPSTYNLLLAAIAVFLLFRKQSIRLALERS